MKKKLVSIMLVAAMALSVAACGSSKGNSAKTDGTEAMASSVSKTPDNQISINLASEPQSIDPALNSAVDGGCMIVNSFAGLYTYDKDGKLIPQLASDMPEVSDDETVYTVKMIKSQWSNGEEVTANDFVYSWNRAADEKTAADYAYLFDIIARNDDGSLAYTREGAHSHNRIIFHEDVTGKEITSTLLAQVKKLSNVTLMEYTTMVDIIERDNKCYGAII